MIIGNGLGIAGVLFSSAMIGGENTPYDTVVNNNEGISIVNPGISFLSPSIKVDLVEDRFRGYMVDRGNFDSGDYGNFQLVNGEDLPGLMNLFEAYTGIMHTPDEWAHARNVSNNRIDIGGNYLEYNIADGDLYARYYVNFFKTIK